MERLTAYESIGGYSHAIPLRIDEQPIVTRLADYEDTGLTPAEVRSMYGEWQAMMFVLNSIGGYDRLRELAEADKESRAIVLKCKPGDTVYLIKFLYLWADSPIEARVQEVGSYAAPNLRYRTVTGNNVTRVFSDSDIGKTVFLTREEAEKALEEAKRHG